jgi:predicted O-methyltransferase YrrM
MEGYMKNSYLPFLKEMVLATGTKSYLELGIGNKGKSFASMASIVEKAVGVDALDRSSVVKNGTFIMMSTDEFFKKNQDMFDFIFIDADHAFDQASKDLCNSMKILNKYGTIVLHDTDPESADLLIRSLCEDSYKIVDYVRENYSTDWESVTLPIGASGMTIVRRKADRRALEII